MSGSDEISREEQISDTESERLDAYEEFFNDLQNEADEGSDDSVKATKKDNYYFDDDFKLSQVEKSPKRSPMKIISKQGRNSPKKVQSMSIEERNIYDFEH